MQCIWLILYIDIYLLNGIKSSNFYSVYLSLYICSSSLFNVFEDIAQKWVYLLSRKNTAKRVLNPIIYNTPLPISANCMMLFLATRRRHCTALDALDWQMTKSSSVRIEAAPVRSIRSVVYGVMRTRNMAERRLVAARGNMICTELDPSTVPTIFMGLETFKGRKVRTGPVNIKGPKVRRD